MSRRSAIAALALLALTACKEKPAQVAARMAHESETSKAGIQANMARWSSHVAAGQADSVGQFYAANTRVMGMNEAVLHGREAVVGSFRNMMGLGTWHINVTIDSVWANGPLIVSTASWTLHFAKGPNAPPGMDTTGSGHAMTRWINEGGQWVIADDIYNSDQPLPPPPPPGRR